MLYQMCKKYLSCNQFLQYTSKIQNYYISIVERLHSLYMYSGAYISENLNRYFLPDRADLGQESCLNTMKEYSEHKIKAIFELSSKNPI